MQVLYTVSGKKEATVSTTQRDNIINKCRCSFVIFGMNHPEDSFY